MIEDEPAIADMIHFACQKENFELLHSLDTPQARLHLARKKPQLIILDWMLPSESGYDFLCWVRKQKLYRHIPIIMLTAKAEEHNKIKALEGGADDYITKPFSPAELIARIKSILRRGQIQAPEQTITQHGLSLNIESHQVTLGEKALKLTPNEYKLLHFFMTHPHRTFDRDSIISHVWGESCYIDERTIDVMVRRLRDKLKPRHHTMITTIRGSGYQFRADNFSS